MAKTKPDVFMPLYIGDYLADTAHLSAAEHGAYLLLIMAYWRNDGPLPDNDAYLKRISRMSSAEWAESAQTLRAFFEPRDGVLRHTRIDAELVAAKGMMAVASQKGKKGAAARWGKGDDAPAMPKQCPGNAQAMHMHQSGDAQAMPGQCYSPSPSPSPSQHPDYPEEDNLGGCAQSGAPPPEDEPIPAFLDRRKPKPERPKAERGTRLPDDWEPDRALFDFAAERGMTDAEAAESLGRFKNYWLSKTGAAATKLRWDLTAKNWISTDADRLAARRAKSENGHDTFRRGLARFVANAERDGPLGGMGD